MIRFSMLLVLIFAANAAAQDPAQVLFERDIQPVLRVRCMSCHGLEDRQGDLDMRTVELLLRGGKSGTAIVPGDASSSLIYQRILDDSMPPAGELRLPEEKQQLIKDWLDQGARTKGVPEIMERSIDVSDRGHWSFKSLNRPKVPDIRDPSLARTPIDRFLLEKLALDGLSYSPVADRRTWIRRLSFDITGLPPTPSEILAFELDEGEGSYKRAIDQLLDKPQFGERWGRHWLDAAGYVDTIGDDTDATIGKVAKGKWRYRDWVVRSLNQNKPFDQFVQEQVAGDEMVDWRSAEEFDERTTDLLIATTFLRSSADETIQDVLNTAVTRHEVAQRTMEVTFNCLLALTMNCARCHDHKYDPIGQVDYYSLLANFTPAFDPQAWLTPKERELPDIPPKQLAQFKQHNAEIDKQIQGLESQKTKVVEAVQARAVAERYLAIPEPIRADVRKAIATPQEERNQLQAYLAEKFTESVSVTAEEAQKLFQEEDQNATKKLDQEIGQLRSRRKSWGYIQAVYNVVDRPPTYVLVRGNHERPALQVHPRSPQVLSLPETHNLFAHESKSRTVLVRWLTDRESPAAALMARVVVNRAWQKLFGRGLVETTDNFGRNGATPSHPELLEWLAAEFVESGWDYKQLLRLMVNSRVYLQQSNWDSQTHEADPANVLLARMPLRQLESEAVRDAILHVSGQLNLKMGGSAVSTSPQPDGFVVASGSADALNRRSMYLLQRRRYHESFLESFGQPELTTNCTARRPTAVVGQSLAQLNGEFLFNQSQAFAKRVIASRKADEPDRDDGPQDDIGKDIVMAYQLALGRTPSKEEMVFTKELVEQQKQTYVDAAIAEDQLYASAFRHLCHMLLCSNEFLYIH